MNHIERAKFTFKNQMPFLEEKLVHWTHKVSKEDIWKVNVVVGLFNRLVFEYKEAEHIIKDTKNPYKLAFHCRNIFEISYVCQYVSKSHENARRIFDDAKNDSLNILSVLHEWSQEFNNELVEELTNAQSHLVDTAKLQGVHTIDEKYLTVERMADIMGQRKEYKITNKVLSKLVHPTAFSIISRPEILQSFNNVFHSLGCYHFIYALNGIEIATNNLSLAEEAIV